MKLLHIADLHLGTKFLNKDKDVRKKLFNNQIDVFKNIIQYCIDYDVRALLIAGDLFDGKDVPLKVEEEVIAGFDLLDQYDIEVYYSTGNHDPKEYFEKLYSLFGDNVKVFSDHRFEEVTIDDQIRIVSCGHETIHESRNLITNFPVKDDDLFTIGLVHCTLDSYDPEEGNYLPTTKQTLLNKKYDYWAIGHIHKRASLDNTIYYPGSVQSINYKEVEQKGGNLIEVIDHQTKNIKFIEFSTIDWINLAIDLDETIDDQYSLINLIKDTIENQLTLSKDALLKINFSGVTKLYMKLKDDHFIDEMVNALKDAYPFVLAIKFKNRDLKPYINYTDYISKKNVLGYIDQQFKNPEKIIEKMIEYEKFASHIVNRDEKEAYIKDLLEEIKDETFLRMVGMHHED